MVKGPVFFVFPFHSGGLGVEGVFARRCPTVRNRPQPFARSQYGRAYGKSCRRGHFWMFPASRSCVSRGRLGIQTCFVTCGKSFCVAGAILLRRFQKMRCSLRGGRSTLDMSIVILRGRRGTLDVSCCVFLRIALSGLRQVATRCKFPGRRGIL